jgi:hypothetical protein
MKAKNKRPKLVYSSSSQVFHLWANQTQSYARQGGRLTRAYFQDESCYSYGAHFEVGRIVEYKGTRVAIVTRRKSSNTTSKHISEAWRAVHGLMPRLKGSTFNVREALLETQGELIDHLMDTFSRRSFWDGFRLFGRDDYYKERFEEFNQTCDALGHAELKLIIPQDFKDLANAHVQVCIARQRERDATKEHRRLLKQAEEVAKNAEVLEAWKRGGPATNFVRSLRPQILRIATVGSGGPFEQKIVETSGGAEVPLVQALALLNKISSGIARRGDKVGEFTFEHTKNGIAKIGCHLIAVDEAKAVLGTAASLKLVAGGRR